VFVAAPDGGPKQDSLALCHQITTLDRAKLTLKLGELSDLALKAIEAGLNAQRAYPEDERPGGDLSGRVSALPEPAEVRGKARNLLFLDAPFTRTFQRVQSP
jgi:hypothetical protein